MLNSYELTEQERGEATYYIFSQGKRLESLSHKLLELVGMDRQEMEFKEYLPGIWKKISGILCGFLLSGKEFVGRSIWKRSDLGRPGSVTVTVI